MKSISLEYFLEISAASTLSEAAEMIGISQQGLSAYLARLEQHYGMQLVVRRPVLALTSAGERVLEAATQVSEIQRSLDRDLAAMKGTASTVLRIAIFEPLTQAIMKSDFLDPYISEHQKISVEFISGGSEDVMSLVSKGRVDAGITAVTDLGEWADRCPELEFYWLSKSIKYLVGAASLLDGYLPGSGFNSSGVDLAAFPGLPLALPYSGTGINKKVRSYLAECGLPCNIVSEGRNDQMLSLYVSRGRAAGICMHSEIGMVISQAAEEVRAYPIASPDLMGHAALLYRKDHSFSEAGNEFIVELKTKWRAEM